MIVVTMTPAQRLEKKVQSYLRYYKMIECRR